MSQQFSEDSSTAPSSLAAQLGKVLVVGGGSMGQALVAGLLRLEGMQAADLCVANPGQEKRAAIEATYGVATVADAVSGLPADTVFFAVKPGIVCDVARELSAAGAADALFISIAAGVSTSKLAACFEVPVSIVRVMPNTPLIVGHGMSAVSGGAHASERHVALVRDVFDSMGHALVVDEDKQDIVTAVSGSGPAYFELFVETIARSAERLGLPYETSLELALQTMYGTAALIDQTGQDLPAAIRAVSSPGGTTVAALDAMRAQGVEEALDAGIAAAARRSAELGA